MSGFIKQTSNTLAAEIASIIIGIITLPILFRTLGPDGHGLIFIYVMVPQVVVLVVELGMNIANTYFIGSRQYTIEEVTTTSFLWSILSAIVGVLGYFVLVKVVIARVYSTGPEGLTPYYIASLFIPFSIFSQTGRSILKGQGLIERSNFARLMQPISYIPLLTVVMILFLFGYFDRTMALSLVVLANAVSFSAEGIVTFMYISRHIHLVKAVRPAYIREGLRYGVKACLANLAQYSNYRLDQFLLKALQTDAAVGLYGNVARITELLWRLPNAAAYVLFPRTAMADRDESGRMLRAVVHHIAFLTVVSAVVLGILSWVLLPLIYSSKIMPALPALVLLLPGTMALAVNKIFTSNLAGRGKPQYASVSSFVSLVVTVILDILLIPRYSITGAAVASSVSYITAFIIILWAYFHETPDRPLDVFLIRREDFSLYCKLYRKALGYILTPLQKLILGKK